MSGKNQYPITLNWQSTNPVTGFNPVSQYGGGSQPSGVSGGVMSGTSTIYSQIIDVSRMDNLGLEVSWTGNPVGTLSITTSVSGVNFNALTFNPSLAQPSGSAGGYSVSLNQLPFKYILLQYTNTSGSGVLTIYDQNKDLN